MEVFILCAVVVKIQVHFFNNQTILHHESSYRLIFPRFVKKMRLAWSPSSLITRFIYRRWWASSKQSLVIKNNIMKNLFSLGECNHFINDITWSIYLREAAWWFQVILCSVILQGKISWAFVLEIKTSEDGILH